MGALAIAIWELTGGDARLAGKERCGIGNYICRA